MQGQLSERDAATILVETAQRREREKEALLSISHEMGLVREKTQLLIAINTHLKQLFYFTHCSISAIDPGRETFHVYLTDPLSPSRFHEQYSYLVTANYPIADGIFDGFLASDEPTVSDYEEVLKGENPPPYARIHYEAGIREAASIPLMGNNEVWGVLHFYSDRRKTFTQDYVHIIKGIAAQVAVAVSNIIAHEEIRNREQEKEELLSISYEIGKVRNRKELLEVINRRVKKLISFTNSHIIRFSEDMESFEVYLTDPASAASSHPDYHTLIHSRYETKDGIVDQVLKSDDPVVFHYRELMQREHIPRYVKIHYESGHREAMVIPLRGEKRTWGFLTLLSDKEGSFSINHLNLLKGIGSQVAIAVSNILSTEAIRMQEQEKAALLEVSYDIGKVRDKNDLLRFINTKLKNLFYFTHSSIAAINEDRKTFTVFLTDENSKSRSHPDFQRMITARYPINDGLFNKFLETDEPTVSDIEYNASQPNAPRYTVIHFEAGLREAVSIPMYGEQGLFGILTFYADRKNNFTKGNQHIIKGVAGQVAIAVSNILAHDDLRKREKEKSQLLSFSHQLASVRDKKSLSLVIEQYFSELFQLSEYVITISSDDRLDHDFFLHRLNAAKNLDRFLVKYSGGRFPVGHDLLQQVLSTDGPVHFTIATLINYRKEPDQVLSFWQSAGFDELLGLRLRAGNENVGILWIRPGWINDELLKGISAQVAIAIANIKANEKIEKQLDEINTYKQQLEEEKLYLQEEVEGHYKHHEIIGDTPEMQKIFHLIHRVATSSTTVLITGETGTGKEMIARAIHNASPRKNKLMVKVNCAALPANLIESELFGHEKGSFTGATDRRVGKFELANNSTLFLDEIGEMPFDLQVKLLRALQEKEIERVGGKSTIQVDVRIVAATNRDLASEVESGHFRKDLFYRLNVFPIHLPPLRERRMDIPGLVAYFIAKYAKAARKEPMHISSRALDQLVNYDWPGNIRELEHLIERSILLTPGQTIREVHLPSVKNGYRQVDPDGQALKTMEESERDHILAVLKRTKGKLSGTGGAAEILDIPYSTLTSKMRKLGIQKQHYYVTGK